MDIFQNQKKSLNKYLIYTLIFLIPLTHKEMFSMYDPDLVWSKFILSAIAISGICLLAKNHKELFKDPFFTLLGLTLLFQILSVFQSKDVLNSLRFIAFQGAVVFAYPVIKDFVKKDATALTKITKLYLVTFIGVFFFFLYQHYMQSHFGVAVGGVWPVPGFSARYAATFWDVNHFGIYLASTFFLFFSQILTIKKKKSFEWGIYLVGLVGVLVAFFFTKSRSSMLGFGAGIALFGYVLLMIRGSRKKRLSQAKVLVIAGIMIPVVPIAVMWVFAEGIRDFFIYRAVSFFSHLFLLKVGILVGLENFLTGIGINSFYAYFRGSRWADAYYYIDAAALDVKLPLHNLWLESLAETGIFGFVVYVSLWVLLLGGLVKLAISKKDFIALGLASGVLTFLIGGLFYSYKSEFFWFYVLMAASYVSIKYRGKYFFIKGNNWRTKVLSFYNTEIRLNKLILNAIAIIALTLPLLLIFKPLVPSEVSMYLQSSSQNVVSAFYKNTLFNFRYVLGSYSYVGRLLAVLFYLGGLFVGYAIFSRFMNKSRIAVIAIVVGLFGFGVFYNMQKSGYDKDLTFMFELAQNRGLFDRSKVYVDEHIDENLLQFYCGTINRVGNEFVLNPCMVESVGELPKSAELKIVNKTVFLGKTEYVNSWNESVSGYNTSLKLVRIDRGDFSLLIFEPRARSPI